MQLKTQRLAVKDLVSTFPAGLSALEADLRTLFGFTADSNITETPLGLSNDGKVTKALLRLYGRDGIISSGSGGGGSGSSQTTLYGVGFGITNSTNSNEAVVSFQSESGSPFFYVRNSEATGNDSILFGVNMDTGALVGYTTQDGSSTPLVPATGGAGSSYYYNGAGTFSVPGNNPSPQGCVLSCNATYTVPNFNFDDRAFGTPGDGDPSVDTGAWTTANPGFDTGSFYDADTHPTRITVPSANAGKYFWFLSMVVQGAADAFGTDALVSVKKNGTSIGQTNVWSDSGDPNPRPGPTWCTMYGVINMAGSDYLEVYIQNNTSYGAAVGQDTGVTSGRSANAKFGMMRVE